MPALEFPFHTLGVGTDFFDYIKRQWPHYNSISFEFSISWSASRVVEFPAVYEGDPPEIECAATTAKDTATGLCSGSISFTRQSEADEISEQNCAENEFSMGVTFSANPSESPRIDSALFHHVNDIGTWTQPTGSWSKTLHTGDACDVIATTTTGEVTGNSYLSGIGVYESGTQEWFSSAEIGVSFFGVNSPISTPGLQSTFLDDLDGPPEGSPIVFSDTATSTSGSDGWTGSLTIGFSATLST